MLHACVQKFNITVTIKKKFGTFGPSKQASRKLFPLYYQKKRKKVIFPTVSMPYHIIFSDGTRKANTVNDSSSVHETRRTRVTGTQKYKKCPRSTYTRRPGSRWTALMYCRWCHVTRPGPARRGAWGSIGHRRKGTNPRVRAPLENGGGRLQVHAWARLHGLARAAGRECPSRWAPAPRSLDASLGQSGHLWLWCPAQDSVVAVSWLLPRQKTRKQSVSTVCDVARGVRPCLDERIEKKNTVSEFL
jgi:hypothetical protein